MIDGALLSAIGLFVLSIAAVTAVALLARRVPIPYTVALVLVGLAIGAIARPAAIEVTPQLVLAILLPGLVFEAAIRIELEDLRPSLLGVALLAVPGVLIGALIVAAVLAAGAGMPFELAFLVGAIVSATDPAAVIATFKRLRAPRTLATFVEAESLFNDGTGIVLFAVAVAGVTTAVDAPAGVVSFLGVTGGSLVLGAAIGLVGGRLLRSIDDHLVELSITLVVCYGSYVAAEVLHLSGILATVTGGLAAGGYARRHGLSTRTREAIETVWEFAGYVMTAIVFLLVGLAIPLDGLLRELGPIAWAIAGILLARAVVVYGLVGVASRVLPRRTRDRPVPAAWLHVLFWSGLRGAVAVALALSIPAGVPGRELVQDVVFGVVLYTLLVHATSAGLVVRRLGLGDVGEVPNTA
jgi:monovalent cation:H+ antiporter, CPA1 family